jgi:hypothetical protein
MPMNTAAPDPTRMEPQLAAHLREVAARLRATRLHRLAMWRWLAVAAVAVALLSLRAWKEELTTLSGVALALVFFGALIRGFVVARRTPPDYAEAARLVETQFPDLKLVLRTAAEQVPDGADGRFSFLQRRVIDESLRHARRHPWTLRARRQARALLLGHSLALAAVLVVAALLFQRTAVVPPWVRPEIRVAVTPGNKEIERNTPLLVDARVSGRFSRRVEIVWQSADGKSGRALMERNLGDPVYVARFPRVTSDLTYSVVHDQGETEKFKITVFDQPALVRADAALSYPAFTKLPDRTFPNTKIVRAVEGTKLQYDFTVNKPLASAVLRDEAGNEVKLTPADGSNTKFTLTTTIAATHTYQLELKDAQQRPNPTRTPITITAVPNGPAQVSLVFPRSDVRVSSLEEMRLSARAGDDFGLLDYGLAIAIGEQEPTYISLKDAPPPANPVAPAAPAGRGAGARGAGARGAGARGAGGAAVTSWTNFEQMLALEPKGIKPDDLVTWFAWADDAGSDGKPRRSTSDLAFAEVRPFEEIFRQATAADAQAAQQRQQQRQQGGQQPETDNELLDLQRQISTAIFNLRRQTEPGPTYAEDVKTLVEEQQRAQQLLDEAKANLSNARQQAAAEQAERFMKQSADNLAQAGDKKSMDPLSPAWTGAQGAYQALLRLQARETRVSQQQRGQQGQQQQRNRNQAQLDQLDFNQQQQDNYQQEQQAQEPMSQEQREQLAVQSRLNELSRRQNDVNERLQEMQTALNAARDEQQREQIRRELQRLEEEQRQMLADLDEARDRLDNLQANAQSQGDQSAEQAQQGQQARQQLEQARQDMQRSNEQLEQGNVQQALAAGTRSQEQLNQARDNLQRQSSSQFAEQMRQARQQARDLAERQQQLEREIAQTGTTGTGRLDDSGQRQALVQGLEQQRSNLENLMNNLRDVTDASETTEPALHNQLYDLLRTQTQNLADTGNNLRDGAELLRRGFNDRSRAAQAGVAQNLDQLRRSVERAADSVLGDETQALQFAQAELADLARQLQQDRQNAPGGNQPGQTPDGQQPGQGDQSQLAQNGQRGAGAPGDQGQQPGQNGGLAQNGQPGNGQQPGQQGGQGGATPSTEDFRNAPPSSESGALAQNGAGQQPGQRGQGGQPGERGGAGQGDPSSQQFAQNDAPPRGGGSGQPGGNLPGRGGQPGQNGQPGELAQNGAGQQPGQGGQSGQRGGPGGQPGGDLAQNDPNGQPGGAGQGQPGQRGGAGQQPGDQPGQRGGQGGQGGAGQPGDLAQNDSGQPGQRGGAGQPGGQRGGQGGGLAQNGQNQPGQNGGGQRAGQPGQRGGQGGQLAQNGGPRQGGGGGGGGALANNALNNVGDLTDAFLNNAGPITGDNYVDWADRLRVVEQLVDDPNLRQQLTNVRANADDLRRAYTQRGTSPQWGDVQSSVLAPLTAVRAELARQLARRTQPDALQPADRDPVPEKYADAVRSYYEALGGK